MNINAQPAAAAEPAADNFAGACMHHRENGQLYARKFQTEITQRKLRRDLRVQPLGSDCIMHTGGPVDFDHEYL